MRFTGLLIFLFLVGCNDYTVVGYTVETRPAGVEYVCVRKHVLATGLVMKACSTKEECNRGCADLNEQLRRERYENKN